MHELPVGARRRPDGVSRPPGGGQAATALHPDLAAGPVGLLLRDLRTRPGGLSSTEAGRRRDRYGSNTLTRRARTRWLAELLAQFTHPLALLLIAASALAFVAGTPVLGWAVVAVVLLNAGFAFTQERQAERAVEALQAYLPQHADVLRDGALATVDAADLVPGDVMLLEEGQRVSADARLLAGEVMVDLSTLTGESAPQSRVPEPSPAPLLEATDVVFSGTSIVGGSGRAVVFATGDHTELGRIASLSQRVTRERSPLEGQVRRVARLIALVAVVAGLAFFPLGILAGLSLRDAFLFAVGLLVANVPEGLLPTITLALAVGVRAVARRGVVVKRLSAVETLGSATVICTDKTGTLTQNRMQPVTAWVVARDVPLVPHPADEAVRLFAEALARCATVHGPLDGGGGEDPTELAAVAAATRLGRAYRPDDRDLERVRLLPFQSTLRLMSTVDRTPSGLRLHVKGAPEAVLDRTTRCWRGGRTVPMDDTTRQLVVDQVRALAGRGLRLLAVADRDVDARIEGKLDVDGDRADLERELRFLGLVALLDPPRPTVADAVERCHLAGIRVHVVTGDSGDTAAEVARQVGIGGRRGPVVLTGAQLANMSDAELTETLARGETVLARTSPEDKLRVADVLRGVGEVVAMTGDGVNDAPALHRADIGVAMGQGGTDVAREAATAVLSDDDFSTLVAAVEEGRRVYDDVRKFIVYIFAHAVPEVVPFLVFALSGGAVPLPLTVLAILAIDLGTETLPALALGREPAEPGLMARPPRPRDQRIVDRTMLVRAWGVLGGVSAALVMLAFFVTLFEAGWRPGDPTGAGAALHGAYLEATTATFVAIVACQVGTALAARTDRASLLRIGLLGNPMLLWGIAFELAFTAALVYLPLAHDVMATAPLPLGTVLLIAPFPVVVWGADELWRLRMRRSADRRPDGLTDGRLDARPVSPTAAG